MMCFIIEIGSVGQLSVATAMTCVVCACVWRWVFVCVYGEKGPNITNNQRLMSKWIVKRVWLVDFVCGCVDPHMVFEMICNLRFCLAEPENRRSVSKFMQKHI